MPKGYVWVLVYNADSVLVDSHTQQLSAAALNSYEELRMHVVAPSDGYLTVYVGNESDTDVYFDDVEVRHNPAILVQENHYDPWGLNLAGLSLLPKLQNKYSWNGKERQDEFGLNWQDHGWRFYDPQLGRWVVTDPDAEEGDQESWTTYQFGFNNTVRYNDPDGRTPVTGALIGIGVEMGLQMATNYLNGQRGSNILNFDYADIAVAGLAGAATGGLSTASKFGKIAHLAGKLGGEFVKAGVDVKTDGVKVVGAGKSVGDATVDLAAGVIGGKAVAGTTKKVVNAVVNPKTVALAEKQMKVAVNYANK